MRHIFVIINNETHVFVVKNTGVSHLFDKETSQVPAISSKAESYLCYLQ